MDRRLNQLRRISSALVGVGVSWAACLPLDEPQECVVGEAGCLCTTDGRCNAGLECKLDLCVGSPVAAASGGSSATFDTTGARGPTSTLEAGVGVEEPGSAAAGGTVSEGGIGGDPSVAAGGAPPTAESLTGGSEAGPEGAGSMGGEPSASGGRESSGGAGSGQVTGGAGGSGAGGTSGVGTGGTESQSGGGPSQGGATETGANPDETAGSGALSATGGVSVGGAVSSAGASGAGVGGTAGAGGPSGGAAGDTASPPCSESCAPEQACLGGRCVPLPCYPFVELTATEASNVALGTVEGACYRVQVAALAGGSCYNFSGRLMLINGVVVECSETTIGAQTAWDDGYVYVEITAGDYDYAGWGTW